MISSSLILDTAEATVELGRRLGSAIGVGDKITLSGPLGAGKTTFARGVLQGMGFAEEVPSPTFAIVQLYEPPEVRQPIAHIDLYRIEDHSEIDELGLDDILIDGAIMAEWPDRMPEIFWNGALRIDLKIEDDETRLLTCTLGGAWKERWPAI